MPKKRSAENQSGVVDIRAIARDTGFSVGTVSMALNDNQQVKKATREAIQRRAAELGYVPNIIAQLVSSRKNEAFGVMVNNSSLPRLPSMVQGILQECERADQPAFVVYHLDSQENELFYLKTFAQLRIRGLIAAPSPLSRCQPIIQKLCDQGCKVVIVNNELKDLPVDYVGFDEKKQAEEVVENFWRAGHRRIGIALAHVSYTALDENLKGYKAVFARNKAAVDPKLQIEMLYDHRPVRTWEHDQNVIKLIRFLKEQKPTALLLAMPALIEACEEAAKVLGIRIPDDLSVVSLDISVLRSSREEILADSQQAVELGRTAAKLLIDRVAEGANTAPAYRRILMERHSTHVL